MSEGSSAQAPDGGDVAILALTRPDVSLLWYYLLCLCVVPPLLPILGVPAYFRYHTMRYRFDDEGISMRVGLLFRREVLVSYSRIQDIHLRANVVERRMGLARVLIQTASGSAGAEMTLEGLREFEAVRDFLYARMRGVREPRAVPPPVPAAAPAAAVAAEGGAGTADLAAVLREVAAEVRGLRADLARRVGADAGGREGGR